MNIELIKRWIENHSPNGSVKLAAEANVSMGTITKIMHGHSPGVDIAKRIAAALNVSLDELVSAEKKRT